MRTHHDVPFVLAFVLRRAVIPPMASGVESSNRMARNGSAANITLPVLLLLLLGVAACSWQKSTGDDGERVNVQTPLGQLKLNTRPGADAQDAGLDVYPGARRQSNRGETGAQAKVALPFVRLKVVGTQYRCPDPPEKVLAFYRKGLARYGQIKEERGGHTSVSMDGFEWHSTKDQVTLSVGDEDTEHVVAVQPDGAGSRFALVYVRARDTDRSQTE
jgi:hypothetical protein